MNAPANPLPILAGVLVLCIVAEFVAGALGLPVPAGSASIIAQLVAGVLALAIPQSRKGRTQRSNRRPSGRPEGNGQSLGGKGERENDGK